MQIGDEAREKELDRIIQKFQHDSIEIIRHRPAYKLIDGKLIREAWGDYINVYHLHEIVDELLNLRLDKMGIK